MGKRPELQLCRFAPALSGPSGRDWERSYSGEPAST
jgi:hypothetical protein